jgi:hypothetical protein
MNSRKYPELHDHSVASKTTELAQAADQLSTFHRISWKEAFGRIVAPAFRLHRYRSAHNKLLQAALSELDKPDCGGCSA